MQPVQQLLRKPVVIILLAIPFLAVGCKKDISDKIDITEHKWDLQSIKVNGASYTPPQKELASSSSYHLTFVSDSSRFWLNTSTNGASGKYQIPNKGKINIDDYYRVTKVGGETELDQKLVNVFREVASYTVRGKRLTFKGAKGKVKFKKE